MHIATAWDVVRGSVDSQTRLYPGSSPGEFECTISTKATGFPSSCRYTGKSKVCQSYTICLRGIWDVKNLVFEIEVIRVSVYLMVFSKGMLRYSYQTHNICEIH